MQEFLRETIAAAGGNEVYFLGRVSWTSAGAGLAATLEDLDVLARGNRGCTPAITEDAEQWDISIHNHPGGDLEPSDADIDVASELASKGVGSAIVSNDGRRHYLIVPPFQRKRVEPVDPEEVRRIFAPEGPLAGGCDEYEAREGQLEMALEVTRALNDDQVLAAEAGTGVGKSFAYLVPAILWSVKNGKRVIVSTGTINLQEQLVGKDLPLLVKVLPVKFQHALIKGRGNYACRRKVEELSRDLGDSAWLPEEKERREMRGLVDWAKSTQDGSRADLTWIPSEAAWEEVMSETDRSLKVNCPHYQGCFYYAAKRRAAAANILVVNHHLFFADLAVRRQTGNYQYHAVLPTYQRVIFDEAHHLEDVASEYFGVKFSRRGIARRFARLQSPADSLRGAIPTLVRRLRKLGDPMAADSIERAFRDSLPDVSARIEEHFGAVEDQIVELTRAREEASDSFDPGGRTGEDGEPAAPEASLTAPLEGLGLDLERAEGTGGVQLRYRDHPDAVPFWAFVSTKLREIQKELSIILKINDRALQSLDLSRLDEETLAGVRLELVSLGNRFTLLAGEIEKFSNFDDSTEVRWTGYRRSGKKTSIEFGSAPIRVSTHLKECVFDPMKTVVLTSATLSAGGKIDFLADRLGLSLLDSGKFLFRQYSSPFDFPRQVLTVVPRDFPAPGSRQYEDSIPEAVYRLLEASGGRAFVLFTSYSLLKRSYALIEGRLRELGLRPSAQGEAGRTELLERFKSGASNVLFGTDSFWEGVDVKGRALESVIITRLPFRVPSEPIQEARLEDIEARGGSAFKDFTVPQAVLKFKQGFGRLIRSKTDRGVVAILDQRILTKPYGKIFLESLPQTGLVVAPLREVARQVKAFFPEEPEAPAAGERNAESAAAAAPAAPTQNRRGPPW